MKRFIALLLIVVLIITGCAQSGGTGSEEPGSAEVSRTEHVELTEDEETDEVKPRQVASQVPDEDEPDPEPYKYEADFESLNDEDLKRYAEDTIYKGIVENLDSDEFFVDNVSTVYISQEYIDELEYNSKPNIYFGFTLAELDEAFQGTRYVFTLGENGETVVKPLEKYDDTYDQVIKNVAVGTGVILVCVTVSVVSAGAAAPAVSMVFATAAKTGTVYALSSGTVSGVAAAAVKGIQTGDMDQALKAGALAGSEAFKWGAIIGAGSGAASQALALKGATLNGLTMNEAATIQKESKYPLEVIEQFHSVEEYKVFKAANLKPMMVNGKIALVKPDFDLKQIDEFGRTNLVRMQNGLAPLDANGFPYELHHIGQRADATLAALTRSVHDDPALHGFKALSEIDRKIFAKQRAQFWKEIANILTSGGV